MDRRDSIKALVLGTVSAGVLLEACKNTNTTVAEVNMDDRMQEEKDYLVKVKAQPNFFDAQEMATITVLADIIMPKDAVSGSASDAKVPEFIEFIVKDMPDHQVPMLGGTMICGIGLLTTRFRSDKFPRMGLAGGLEGSA